MKPIYPDLSSNIFINNSNEQNTHTKASAPLFEDIELDNYDISPPDRQNSSTESNFSTPLHSLQQRNAHHIQQHDNFNENISDTNADGVILLMNANEHLTVSEVLSLLLISLIHFSG